MPPPEIDQETIDQLTQSLRGNVEQLARIIANNHGFFRGTHEVVLAEAQGASFSSATFQHIQDLENTGAALEGALDQVGATVSRIARVDNGAAMTVSRSLKDLLELARGYRNQIWETRNMATTLAENYPERLKDIPFERGGVGTTIVRNQAALITTQLRQMAAGLSAQGLPTTLLPEAVAEGEELLEDISHLPVNQQQAVSSLTAVLATVRMYFSAAAVRATAVSTTPLLRALGAAFEALIAVGGRLISVPILIMDPKKLRPGGGDTEA
jgi:hypothetical protein